MVVPARDRSEPALSQLERQEFISITLEQSQMITNEHGGIRTPDPQNRNLMLYPLSYMPLYPLRV